ncbi:hypothetical protein HNP37_004821 [Flavobacterium nitrogenifigens]|uniref:GmrSD restriction endonucleases C-terminal domain-containing protein n=2 Tax=Flavobacterium TaxID=237 RepID=A0A7W7N9B7_9FLAO|nr:MULTISPECIES: DUF1524 domain-containing protein [Flavobacterium]MBB4804723.1 hypothetical protein [Flavobacterium nitrogenifigens]MBB6389682.1 hypothetical protein [Flavobacterium notoginsengisoli]
MVTLNRNEVVTLNWKTVVNMTEFYSLETLNQIDADKFGNLCLISNNTNSRLWNLPPEGKKSYFLNTNKYESLKQKIMLHEPKWTLTEIEKHGKEMINKLIVK